MDLNRETETDKLVGHILSLSLRISAAAPVMKPFVRFSPYGQRASGDTTYARRFWDFDDMVQKELLALARELASPDALVRACLEQWKSNLQSLHHNRREQLERARRGEEVQTPDLGGQTRSGQFEFITRQLGAGSRFLYIGCGSGTECFSLSRGGLQVVGIDTLAPLVDVAGGWAAHLGLPVRFACMNVMALGFREASFDGFLLEFYGSLPAFGQTLALQRGLAHILRPGGRGIISAARKRYASYWWRARTIYPPPMTEWLMPHAAADFLFAQADGCEERLLYGLFNRSHTVDSLSAELSHTFEVADCSYSQDSRYVVANVRRKEGPGPHTQEPSDTPRSDKPSPSRLAEIRAHLDQIEALCARLEAHEERVTVCFSRQGERIDDCLQTTSASPVTAEFFDLLQAILAEAHSPGQIANATHKGCTA